MPVGVPEDGFERFRVEAWADWVGGFVARHPRLWRSLGDLETRRLNRTLDGIAIQAPIFICGLARSSSTILLECLAAHQDTVTHRYRDYPGVLAPVFWDRISARLYANRSMPVERAHGDGIAITPDSPEAMEEMLWMAFYPQGHDPARDNTVGRGGVVPEFANFYRDHIRKLLWLRQGRRYLAKGNYNLARLGGLIDLFPDARLIVPLRDPVTHIASLMRQHSLFCAAEARHPAALRYMQRVGHFEFGLDRRPLNLGNVESAAAVLDLWSHGHDAEGWSFYWAYVHNFLADLLEQDAALRQATLFVPFEELCTDPVAVLGRVLSHAGLTADESWTAALARRIRAPAHDSPLDETTRRTILRFTASAAKRVGYQDRLACA
ncbi:MAG: sulfotransferase [Rhizobiales bacterium]|nr:sulfotransferase [Hyphomicrobiales bacterium]